MEQRKEFSLFSFGSNDRNSTGIFIILLFAANFQCQPNIIPDDEYEYDEIMKLSQEK